MKGVSQPYKQCAAHEQRPFLPHTTSQLAAWLTQCMPCGQHKQPLCNPLTYVICVCIGLARTIFIYGVFGSEITKYTVIYGVYIRFCPTLCLQK